MKELEFFKKAEIYWVTNFPKKRIENSYFKSVMKKFNAKLTDIEELSGETVCFFLELKVENSQKVMEWIKNYVKTIKN